MPEPHCFTYPNGALRDNPKSDACKILKGIVNTEAPQNSSTVNAVSHSISTTLPQLLYLCTKSCLLCLIYVLMFMNRYQRHKRTQKERKRK